MARSNAMLLALNRGEVSKLALARIDVEKLRMAASCQLNWLPYVQGPMMLRPGLGAVGEVLSDQVTKLIPFVFSKLDTALIELTNLQMRIWIGDQLVTRAAVPTQINDPTFTGSGSWTVVASAGATVTQTGAACLLSCPPIGGLAQVKQPVAVGAAFRGVEHGVRIVVANGPVTVRIGTGDGFADLVEQTSLDTGVHSLAFTPNVAIFYIQIESTDAWLKAVTSVSIDNPSSGSPVALTLPTTWATADLPNVRYDQSGDIIYLACYGQQQQMIQRRSTHGWSTVVYRSSDGPFQSTAGADANFTPSVYYGNGALASDRPYFQPAHVGCLFRLFSSGQVNQAVLGNQNAFSPPARITGVGDTARDYAWNVTGSYVGQVTHQRSFDGPTSGFSDVVTEANGYNGAITSLTGTTGTPDLDNAIAWERVGFKAGNYTSGSATVATNYGGGGGFGICRVTAYNNPQSVNIEVLQPFPSLNATSDWVEADWSGVVGYPTSVAFHEGRLGWFGRDRIWLSASDGFYSFASIDSQGNAVGDAGPIVESFGYGPVDTVSWGLSLTRLLCGREESIASVRSSNFDQPLTASAIVIRDCSDEGAQRLPAVKVGKRGIFVQQSDRKVYELAFNAQEMDYGDRDLTRLNLDIGLAGFTAIARSVQPDRMIWLPRGDGQCAALLYDVDDDVVAWWRLQTLGVIEDVCRLPAAGVEDYVYFVVRRTVNGVTRRFIEKLAPRTACVGGAINQQLDCALTYQGAAVSTLQHAFLPSTTITVWADGGLIGTTTTDSSGNFSMPDGKSHSNVVAGLAGATVSATSTTPMATLTVGTQYNGYPCEVFADIGGTGALKRVGPLVVSGGAVTLPNGGTATNIVAFLGYVAVFESAKLAYAAPGASPLNERSKIDRLGLVLYDTSAQGIQFGQRPDVIDNLPAIETDATIPASTVWPEYEEPMVTLPGEWTTDARLLLVAQAPTPCTVGAVALELTKG
jgi:hypothetical protein